MESGCSTLTTTKRVCIFPPLMDGVPQPDSIEIFESDLTRLNEGQWLNDSLVDFYLKFLHSQPHRQVCTPNPTSKPYCNPTRFNPSIHNIQSRV
jgi:Ulp1 family protease